MQVIADFDMTLTHYSVNGRGGSTSFSEFLFRSHHLLFLCCFLGVIETSPFMPEAYHAEVTHVL